jgi:dGTPase
LNLTFEVREGIVKHSKDLEPGGDPILDAFLPGLRPPLEAQLIDLADEIAYNTADLDDGFSASMLEAEDVASSVPLYAAIYESTQARFPQATERERFHESLRRLIDALVSGLIQGTVEAVEAAGVSDCEDVRRHLARLAAFTSESGAASRSLKQFLYRKVYASAALEEDRRRSMAMIGDLFRFFLEFPERLPDPYSRQAAAGASHRVICDYIAGMTDGFFQRTYEQTIGPTATLPRS